MNDINTAANIIAGIVVTEDSRSLYIQNLSGV
jgi:hypothetical protein